MNVTNFLFSYRFLPPRLLYLVLKNFALLKAFNRINGKVGMIHEISSNVVRILVGGKSFPTKGKGGRNLEWGYSVFGFGFSRMEDFPNEAWGKKLVDLSLVYFPFFGPPNSYFRRKFMEQLSNLCSVYHVTRIRKPGGVSEASSATKLLK